MDGLVLYKDTPQILEDFANELKKNLKLNLSARRTRKRYDSRFGDGNLNPATRIKDRMGAPRNLNASGRLSSSIDSRLFGLTLYISFNEYGVMLDRGRDGWKLKQKANDSLLSDAEIDYDNYDNLKKNINKWVQSKHIRPRKSFFGRAELKMNKKQMSFLIRRSLLNRGMNATYWFTRPYKALSKDLPENLIFGMHKTIDNAFDNIFNKYI